MNIDVARLAKLSRLRIDESQKENFEHQMQDILAMVDKLPALSSNEKLVDPENPMQLRKDVAQVNYRREEILKNAPQTQAGCVVVPKVMDD